MPETAICSMRPFFFQKPMPCCGGHYLKDIDNGKVRRKDYVLRVVVWPLICHVTSVPRRPAFQPYCTVYGSAVFHPAGQG
jgi:hypothetical protein